MAKRGQVTLFIIAGIIVISVLGVAFSLREKLDKDLGEVSGLSRKALEKKYRVEGCISFQLGTALKTAASTGGEAVDSVGGVAVYLQEPSLGQFEPEIKGLLKPLAEICMKEYGGAVESITLEFDEETTAVLSTTLALENERVPRLRVAYPADFASAVEKLRGVYNHLGDLVVVTEGAVLEESSVDGYQVYSLIFNGIDMNGYPLRFNFAVVADPTDLSDLTVPEIREEVFEEFDLTFIADADEESGLFGGVA
ncbi:hypothetical protein HY501_00645 [Candidatus Woesearchaeota archaeon]|nr:hypothetical protein [Candidatus Woesearchaeota archaeon]